MKVIKVEEVDHRDLKNVYKVTIDDSTWWRKKELHRTILCRWTGEVYMFGNGYVYYDQNGQEIKRYSGIGEAIDAYRKRW